MVTYVPLIVDNQFIIMIIINIISYYQLFIIQSSYLFLQDSEGVQRQHEFWLHSPRPCPRMD